MIQYISIKNFAVIEDAEIEFENGLNIITGETGSGKSIVIEAISLALGSRADSSFVRHGTSKAVIQLVGDLESHEIVISREISASGKNLCRLNGRIVTLAELNGTCEKLADIYGQYDNQSLLNADNHLRLVDRFRAKKTEPLKASFRAVFSDYTEARAKLDKLVKTEADNKKKLDFYRYEINEIDKAGLVLGEDEALSERVALLQNSEKIYSGVETAYDVLNRGDTGVVSALGASLSALREISAYSKNIALAAEEIADIYYRMEDINTSLREVLENISFTPEELDRAISRLYLIDGLKRKYGPSIGEILAYREKIACKLNSIENFDEIKGKLAVKVDSLYKEMKAQGDLLTEARKESASALGSSIEKELSDLNFNSAEISFDFKTPQRPTFEGNDIAEILISANKGEPLKPLAKIASGGEISRIMLAIKNITGSYDNIPTMIFDEIDAGISGITASVVGRKLREIAKGHQIICITHLPQIAAAGDANYRIYKESDGKSTFTKIQRLHGKETIDEIARLLGGEHTTDAARRNAEELMKTLRS